MIALQLVASCLMLVFGAIARPSRVRCPPGWYVNGVRPNGMTTCRYPLPYVETEVNRCWGKNGRCDLSGLPPDPEVFVRVYCRPGAARVLDARTIACAHR